MHKMLAIDGYNMFHRARSGFTKGNNPVVYNFFRGLKALVEQQKPSRVVIALEGNPHHRFADLQTYKANRAIDATDPKQQAKIEELKAFHAQKSKIIDLLSMYFPVSVVRHAELEADDTIYNLVKTSSTIVPWTVVSTDTDFIQLLQKCSHVSLYNPVKKCYLEAPSYDYVAWKALRGDGSDNIPGIPGVGDKTAEALLNEANKLEQLLSDTQKAQMFERNKRLIQFKDWDQNDLTQFSSSTPVRNWANVKEFFDDHGFQSMTNEKYWSKFVQVFDPLFDDNES